MLDTTEPHHEFGSQVGLMLNNHNGDQCPFKFCFLETNIHLLLFPVSRQYTAFLQLIHYMQLF